MSDEKRQQQIEKEIIKENYEKVIKHDQSRDEASYQPEKSELDDNNPLQEDSES